MSFTISRTKEIEDWQERKQKKAEATYGFLGQIVADDRIDKAVI